MTCPDCDGECVVEVLTAGRCMQPISKCCGGCSELADCPRCHGTGAVDEEEGDTHATDL